MNRISNSINIRYRCFHFVINHNTTFNAKFYAGIFRKCGFGSDANCHYNHISMKCWSIFEFHINTTIGISKTFNHSIKHKMDTIFEDFSMNKRCHIPIKWSHKLIRCFHKRYIYSKIMQIFRNLYSDKATSDYHSRLRLMLIRIFL